MKYYLAVDIGASSGRHIVGRVEDGENKDVNEVYRFPNHVDIHNGHKIWDTGYSGKGRGQYYSQAMRLA